ncbi:hypothetical protein ACE38V_09825 [Cytobacillus sp. Hz8]|uniref:hypothetical protein n=1 Tax=Cytobacillus sp. Hz8 TaxID=3347168 RepID=UPI0035DEB515
MTPRDAQDDMSQYQMPEALREKRHASYRVGYNATTGNQTPGEPDLGKRSDLKN